MTVRKFLTAQHWFLLWKVDDHKAQKLFQLWNGKQSLYAGKNQCHLMVMIRNWTCFHPFHILGIKLSVKSKAKSLVPWPILIPAELHSSWNNLWRMFQYAEALRYAVRSTTCMKMEGRNQSKMIWALLSLWTTKKSGVRKTFSNFKYMCVRWLILSRTEVLDNEILYKEPSV